MRHRLNSTTSNLRRFRRARLAPLQLHSWSLSLERGGLLATARSSVTETSRHIFGCSVRGATQPKTRTPSNGRLRCQYPRPVLAPAVAVVESCGSRGRCALVPAPLVAHRLYRRAGDRRALRQVLAHCQPWLALSVATFLQRRREVVDACAAAQREDGHQDQRQRDGRPHDCCAVPSD